MGCNLAPYLKRKNKMNTYRKVEKLGKVALVSAGTALTLFSGSLLAALPASVTTDLAEAKTDIIAVGAIVIGLAVAVAAIFWVKKPIR